RVGSILLFFLRERCVPTQLANRLSLRYLSGTKQFPCCCLYATSLRNISSQNSPMASHTNPSSSRRWTPSGSRLPLVLRERCFPTQFANFLSLRELSGTKQFPCCCLYATNLPYISSHELPSLSTSSA